MEHISCKEARDHLSEVINEVSYGHKRYALTRHGTEVAVLLSISEWNAIASLIEKWEDEEDIFDAEASRKRYLKSGGTPLSKVKKELGL